MNGGGLNAYNVHEKKSSIPRASGVFDILALDLYKLYYYYWYYYYYYDDDDDDDKGDNIRNDYDGSKMKVFARHTTL